MASKDTRFYRSHRPIHTVISIILITAAIVFVFAVTMFFGFRKYIVYTDDGVRLEVPWLDETDGQSDE